MVTTLFALCVPLVAVILFGAIQHKWIGNIYLPSSKWNDEVLYFKQVEGIVTKGLPRGYFGYNESSAKVLTFSAWSPVIMIPYALWGCVFGWKLMSPILCNVFLLCIGFAIFIYKSKVDYTNLGILSLLLVVMTPLSRFALSCMSDCEIVAMVMAYMGFYIDGIKKSKTQEKTIIYNEIALCVCSFLLTLMRPYFLVLFFAPVYFLYARNKRKSLLYIPVIGVSGGLYAFISSNFTAAYFSPLINTDWIKEIFNSPIVGLINAVKILVKGIVKILGECKSGLINGDMEGSLWFVFIALMVCISFIAFKKHNYIWWIIVLMLVLGAIVMFYDIHVGSRHLLPFIVLMLLLIGSSEINYMDFAIIIALLILFPVRIGADEYNYCLPVYDETISENLAKVEKIKDDMVVLKDNDYWDNTVIWLLYDETVLTWQYLYAMPEGAGINLCQKYYVADNLASLKSKYIAVNSGQMMDNQCDEFGAEKIIDVDGFAIWKLR